MIIPRNHVASWCTYSHEYLKLPLRDVLPALAVIESTIILLSRQMKVPQLRNLKYFLVHTRTSLHHVTALDTTEAIFYNFQTNTPNSKDRTGD